jgi:hypothetical protein
MYSLTCRISQTQFKCYLNNIVYLSTMNIFSVYTYDIIIFRFENRDFADVHWQFSGSEFIPDFNGVRCALSLVFCVDHCPSLFLFAFSVLRIYNESSGIFKVVLKKVKNITCNHPL